MNRINNIKELLSERKRLEIHIAEKKLAIKAEFTGLKDKLEPFLTLLPVLNIFRKKEASRPLLGIISSLGIDLVSQKFLSKAGWITKFIVPLLVKGVSSSMIRRNKTNGAVNEIT